MGCGIFFRACCKGSAYVALMRRMGAWAHHAEDIVSLPSRVFAERSVPARSALCNCTTATCGAEGKWPMYDILILAMPACGHVKYSGYRFGRADWGVWILTSFEYGIRACRRRVSMLVAIHALEIWALLPSYICYLDCTAHASIWSACRSSTD